MSFHVLLVDYERDSHFMDCDNHPFMKGSISPSHQRTRGVLQPLFTCIRQSDHHHFSGHLGLKIGYPQKNPMEKKPSVFPFKISPSHHWIQSQPCSHVCRPRLGLPRSSHLPFVWMVPFFLPQFWESKKKRNWFPYDFGFIQ